MTDHSLFNPILCAVLATAAGTAPLRSSDQPGAGAPAARAMLDLLAGLKDLEPTRAYLEWGLTGGLLEGHAVRGHRIGPGADLRNADLRWADLRRCNLERADLRGADLTGARLGSALLRGARLEGALLNRADLAGALEPDLAGARLHPFFDEDPDEPVGTVRILRVSEPGREDKAQPRNLVCGPDGRLFWTQGDHPDIQAMSPTGENLQVSPSGDTRIQAMVRDSRNRMWCFGDRRLSLFDLGVFARTATGTLFQCDYAEFPIAAAPSQVTAGADGDGWLSLPGKALQLNFGQVAGKFNHKEYPFFAFAPDLPADARVVSSRDGRNVCFAPPGAPRVFAWRRGTRKTSWLELPTGKAGKRELACQVQGLAMGPDDRVWLTHAGFAGLTEIYPEPGVEALATETHPLAAGKVPSGPQGLAVGPDGFMWFTLTAAGQIGRIGPGGEGFRLFDLPPGTRPVELVCGHDGRLLFTLEGRNAIGSIRAARRPGLQEPPAEDRAHLEAIAAYAAGVEAKTEAKTEAKAEVKAETKAEDAPAALDPWTGPAYRPKPARVKPLTQAQRWAAHLERERLAERRREAREAEESKEAAPAADPGPEPKDEAAVASRPDPVLRLGEANVYLTPGAVRHVQRRHARHAGQFDSQFAKAHWELEALERLIATGLLDSGAIGRELSRRRPELDRSATFYTRCRAKDVVGTCCTRSGARVETRAFEVCTLRYWQDGVEVHVVKTAYPVLD